MKRIRACSVDDIAPGNCLLLPLETPISIFNIDGEFLAIDDTCTHADASLADGFIDDGCVECPVHSALFNLRTGAPLGPPASEPLRTHPVTIEGTEVFVEVAE